jgi:hypothetical protein
VHAPVAPVFSTLRGGWHANFSEPGVPSTRHSFVVNQEICYVQYIDLVAHGVVLKSVIVTGGGLFARQAGTLAVPLFNT